MKTKLSRNVGIMLAVFFQACLAGGDFGNWYATTPYGNTLNNEYSVIFFQGRNADLELQHLERWFFYKSYIAGSCFAEQNAERKYDESRRRYFVIDEKRGRIKLFDTREEWLRFRENQGINPVLVTRWFDHDWQFFSDESFVSLGLLVQLLIFLAVLAVFVYSVIISFRVFVNRGREAWRAAMMRYMKKPLLLISAIAVFVLIRMILDAFPQSI